MPSSRNIIDYDVIVVGGGFSGCYVLKLLRDQGFSVLLLEANSRLGGVWVWTCYPGARVDSELPYYGYSDPAIWSTWKWTERFSSHQELRGYFDHVDKVWDLSPNVSLNTRVTGAQWSDENATWLLSTGEGQVHYRCTWFISAIGTSSKPFIPDFKGLASYKGTMVHSSSWPEDAIDIAGKRVAIIGAGSTGVQIMQESAKKASRVVQYSKTPNYALPMRQRQIKEEEIYTTKAHIPYLFKACRTTRIGLPVSNTGKKTFDVSDEEREAIWEDTWKRGGFNWSQGGFIDTVFDPKANRAAYDFWCKKIRARITDPVKADILAPREPPYYILTKRPSLEQDYFEMCDRPNVELTNSPILEFHERGIVTKDGQVREFDVVALCTGYDAVTGGLRTMNIKGRDGLDLDDKWKDGIQTHLGMVVNGFPNMFIAYGPQAPTSLTNGPPFVELQSEWIVDVLSKQRKERITALEPKLEKEEAWRKTVAQLADSTLLSKTKSWYTGSNVPGKRNEFLLYLGGIPQWREACDQALKDWDGFDVKPRKDSHHLDEQAAASVVL